MSRLITVSFGRGNPAVITEAKQLSWDQFAAWLTELPPAVADKADRGWYCPTEFSPEYRDSENFVGRHAITFDFDRVDTYLWGQILETWSGVAFAIYTTFTHTPEKPRFRVVVPLSRPAGFDEFQAVARKVAADVGIENLARESFVPAQMMFSPTMREGSEHRSHVNVAEWLDVDAVLDEYADWTDVKSWPKRVDGDPVHASSAEKVDPREKPGIIGEFNRAFSISQAIERFQLPYARVR